MRKEIPYEEMNLGENKMRFAKLSVNNKHRMDTIKRLIRDQPELIKKLKIYGSILSNWLSYVGYLQKEEFYGALESIGVKYEAKLFDEIFWLYDLNGDAKVDEKEF